MNIAIVGLGLIGGSFLKALRARTQHRLLGLDTDPEVLKDALHSGALDASISPGELSQADLTLVCLSPDIAISFLQEHAASFRPGSIVSDMCGVKETVVQAVEPVLLDSGIQYVGAHPMAGREFSGFSYAKADLYEGASFILTPTSKTSQEAISTLKELALSVGFSQVVISSPLDHDKNIAFTSQLAHIVSNAYIKSPTLWKERGFSAGSFLDLTRVAKLNEEMWSALFLMNREPLLTELDILLTHLNEYRKALIEDDRPALRELLREGRVLKELSLMGE